MISPACTSRRISELLFRSSRWLIVRTVTTRSLVTLPIPSVAIVAEPERAGRRASRPARHHRPAPFPQLINNAAQCGTETVIGDLTSARTEAVQRASTATWRRDHRNRVAALIRPTARRRQGRRRHAGDDHRVRSTAKPKQSNGAVGTVLSNQTYRLFSRSVSARLMSVLAWVPRRAAWLRCSNILA